MYVLHTVSPHRHILPGERSCHHFCDSAWLSEHQSQTHSISTLKAISVYAFNMYIKQNGTHKTLKEDEIADCNALLISSVVLDLETALIWTDVAYR